MLGVMILDRAFSALADCFFYSGTRLPAIYSFHAALSRSRAASKWGRLSRAIRWKPGRCEHYRKSCLRCTRIVAWALLAVANSGGTVPSLYQDCGPGTLSMYQDCGLRLNQDLASRTVAFVVRSY